MKAIIFSVFCLSAMYVFAKEASFKDVQPSTKYNISGAELAAPDTQKRSPATAMTPKIFIDKENNVACYYITPTDSMNAPTGIYAAIDCVKLGNDKTDKKD